MSTLGRPQGTHGGGGFWDDCNKIKIVKYCGGVHSKSGEVTGDGLEVSLL